MLFKQVVDKQHSVLHLCSYNFQGQRFHFVHLQGFYHPTKVTKMFLNLALVFIRTSSKLMTTALIFLSDSPHFYILSLMLLMALTLGYVISSCCIQFSFFGYNQTFYVTPQRLTYTNSTPENCVRNWRLRILTEYVLMLESDQINYGKIFVSFYLFVLCVFFLCAVEEHTSAMVPVQRSEDNL